MFFRDTLSYLVLLGFHFALCLETSSIQFSGLEWAILVFFLGRILNEIKQFLDVKVKRQKKTGIKNSEGSNIRFENGVENSKRQGKSVIVLQKCSKYLRYHVIGFKRRRSTCSSSGSLFQVLRLWERPENKTSEAKVRRARSWERAVAGKETELHRPLSLHSFVFFLYSFIAQLHYYLGAWNRLWW